MTIRVGTDFYGHHSHMFRMARQTTAARKVVTRQGIRRSPRARTAQDRPLSERHMAILKVVDIVDPIRVGEIADVLQMNPKGVNSSLYALQDRGLVSRVPYKGWVRS